MKKILAVLAVLALVAGYAVAQSGLPNAASTNAGWHSINPATSNGPVLAVTQGKAAITATGAVTLVQSRVSLTDTNGVTASVVTNVTGTVAITVLNGAAVVTNVAVSIQFEPFTGPTYVNP